MNVPEVIILADGGKEGGGSGVRVLLEKIESGQLKMKVNAIVSGHWNGGVDHLAEEFGLPFLWTKFPKRTKKILKGKEVSEFSEEDITKIRRLYREIMTIKHQYIFLSGWMRYIITLPSNKTINIHPGPTQGIFGGKGMYGDIIHKKVWELFQKGLIKNSAVTMHYVTEKIDGGPIICQIPVDLIGATSWEDIKKRTNKETEHIYQWVITQLLVEGKITWSGEQSQSVEWDKSITPEYMKKTFGVEWKKEWQSPLPEFEAFKDQKISKR